MGRRGRRRKSGILVRYRLEYWLTRLVGILAKGMSLKVTYFIGDRIGDLFFYLLRIRRDVAFNNLKHAFGHEKSEQELTEILHRNYCHFGRMLLEFARFQVLDPQNILQETQLENKEILENALAKNKGVLVLSGHFGNWEYLAATVAQIGPPLYAVFKAQKNLLVDDLIKQQRMKLGLRPLAVKGGAARGIIAALRKKAKVLIVFDQDAGGKGRFVNFLGRPASTADGPARIAIKHNIPTVFAISIRTKRQGIKIILEGFPSPDQFSGDDAGIEKFIETYNQRLESYIRQYPEQWFWMHRRWLTWERHVASKS